MTAPALPEDAASNPADQSERLSPPTDPDQAYVALVARSQPALRTFLHALVRRGADVDDALQETNVVLWQKRHEYDPQRPFLPWACTVARLQALAHLKRSRRHEHAALNEELFAHLADAAARHVEHTEAQLQALRECLEKLPQRYDRIVRWRYGANRSVKEIADATQQSADAVSMALYRARRQLNDCVRLTLHRWSYA